MKLFSRIALAAAAAALTLPAAAQTTNLRYDGLQNQPGIATQIVAGGNAATWILAGVQKYTNMDANTSFLAYCIELADGTPGVGPTVPYTVNNLTDGPSLTSSVLDSLARLFTVNGGVGASTAERAAAMQLAVWNLVYDTDLTTTSGSFRSITNNATVDPVEALADSLLSQLASTTPTMTVTTYGNDTYQNIVTATQLVPQPAVPEPATWGMLAIGLVAAGAASRRRA